MADPTDLKPAAPPADAPTTKDCPFCGETIKAVAIRCKHCQADLRVAPDFDRGVRPEPKPEPKIEAAKPEPKPQVQAEVPVPAAPRPMRPEARASFAAKIRDRLDAEKNQPTTTDMSEVEFERRFLDFAYETHEPLNAISVAHALKIPIAQADERLESLAASDVIIRDVDDEGVVYYQLPARNKRAMMPRGGALVPIHPMGPNALRNIPPGIDPSLVIGPPPPTEAAAVTGLVLNLCMPGVGSIVAGKPGPGIAQLAMLVAGVPLCFVLIGFPLVFAAWLWSIMTAAAALQEARRAPA